MAEPKDEFRNVMTEVLDRYTTKLELRIDRLELYVDDRLREFEKRLEARFDLRFQQSEERQTKFERHLDRRIDDIMMALEALGTGYEKMKTRIDKIETRVQG